MGWSKEIVKILRQVGIAAATMAAAQLLLEGGRKVAKSIKSTTRGEPDADETVEDAQPKKAQAR